MRKMFSLLCLVFGILLSSCSDTNTMISETASMVSATPSLGNASEPAVKTTSKPTVTISSEPSANTSLEPSASATNIANTKKLMKGLYFTNLPQQLSPKNLLVLIFDYKNGYYEDSDEHMESAWSKYIFGTGSYEAGTASINDYFKEISNGKFYYNPILIGDNTTGVYSFHLDKDYSDEQGLHPEWPFFEFQYDMMQALDSLAAKGLDIDQFAVTGVNRKNYSRVMVDFFSSTQKERPAQWFGTSTLLCIFPTYNTEKMDLTPLSMSKDKFTLYTHINHTSSFGIIAHELGHTLGAVDVYNFGSYASDLMSHASTYMPEPYKIAHINPFYKIIYGWVVPSVISDSTDMTLFPATSAKYKPVIVRTDDGDQYYVIENRKSEKFDKGLDEAQSDGINIWRIDKLGCEAIYKPRKGISLEGILRLTGESVHLKKYASNEINNTDEKDAGITVQQISSNADGSVTVSISFD